MKYFFNLRDAWHEYRLIHTISSRIAGLSLIAFCCACFWMIFQRGEPTTIALALLGFIAFCGVFLIGGQKAAETWAHRRDQGLRRTFSQQTYDDGGGGESRAELPEDSN